MKVSLNWINDFVKVPVSPEELAERLTLSTCEVEEVIDYKKQFDGIVVAKVSKKEKHPDADKLAVAHVDFGEGEIQVVCGAPNLEEGQMVPFAKTGTTLPNGLTLKKMKIRGVESNGMICAEDEIGLGDDHSGIMVLDEHAEMGMPFAEYLGADDVVLEIDNKSITHRPDLFSHGGMAGEIAALYDIELGKSDLPKETESGSADSISVSIEDTKRSRRYIGVVLDGITMNETPEFIQKRLQAIGMRPINLVVDIANYVMFEWGQPLHTFDFDKLAGDTKDISVRNAKKGEKLTVIDGSELELSEDDLVIADGNGPIALAGVMGGKNSEVDENTTKIVLESAHFDGPTVRRASWRHGIRSEAILRFEKGLPVTMPGLAMKRFIQLMQEHAGAHVSSEIVDENPEPYVPVVIELDPKYMERVLGFEIPEEEIVTRLEALHFTVEKQGDVFSVTVPWFREGMELEEELIEEIGRLRGTDTIEPAPFEDLVRPVKKNPEIALSREIKTALVAAGLDEVYTYSFYGEKLLKNLSMSAENHIQLAEPLSKDLALMRKSLAPYLLEKMGQNVHNVEDPSFFEVGHVYDGEDEYSRVSGVMHGSDENVFYQMKGAVQQLLDALNIPFEMKPGSSDSFLESVNDERSVAHFVVGEDVLGYMSLVRSDVLKKLSIKQGDVVYFDFDLRALLAHRGGVTKFSHISEFPAATIDLAFVMKNTTPLSDVEKVIREESGKLLSAVNVFDIYRGKPLEDDQKSVAFHLKYQSVERTLQDKEVKDIRSRIEQRLSGEFGAQIRDY